MRLLQLLGVLLYSFIVVERQGYSLVVDGVDLTHIRTRCKNVTCAQPNCPYPILDDNNRCCFTCPPHRGLPLEMTLPPPPAPCGNSTECPDTFCPVPIITCDCCKTCKQDCRVTFCPRPSCLNPVIPPGECCGQCEADCTLVDCAPLECTVANQTHKPGACCPSCIEVDGVDSNDSDPLNSSCPDHFCPNPVDCNGCKTCRQDCRAVTCIVSPCPNPIVAPGECCGTCERDCRTVRCARPLCVNPTYKPGACCPTCDDDICKYSGCVNTMSNDTWHPDHCTTCKCSSDGQSVGCVGTPCAYSNCSGRPFRTVPGNCCPTCDYGISDKKCGVVPLEERPISVKRRSRMINTSITIHQCDKQFIRKRNTIFSCVPKYGQRRKKLPHNQRPHIRYRDVIKCKPVRWSSTCDLFIQ